MSTSYSFGNHIRSWRKHRDLTQGELAQLVGCSISTIQKYENNALRPAKPTAARLASILGIPEGEQPGFLAAARQPLGAPQPTPDSGEHSLAGWISRLLAQASQNRELREPLPDIEQMRVVALADLHEEGQRTVVVVLDQSAAE